MKEELKEMNENLLFRIRVVLLSLFPYDRIHSWEDKKLYKRLEHTVSDVW